jgi:NAD(P)-dependent dehydrogenase (short-subunit alcohol dehydrogenase family)
VVITSRTAADVEERSAAIRAETGGNVLGVPGDVSSNEDVDAMIGATVEAFGGLDILVNNAGINVRGLIGEIDRSDFEHSLDVNLTGPWMLCRAAEPHLKASPAGRVINISSTFGIIAAPARTAYATTKGAILQLTRVLALEWADDGIMVNAIAPGPFLTEMNIPHKESEHAVRVLTHEVPLQRWGEMHEIQGAALYLASDAASYVTGSVLTVDGGWTAH